MRFLVLGIKVAIGASYSMIFFWPHDLLLGIITWGVDVDFFFKSLLCKNPFVVAVSPPWCSYQWITCPLQQLFPFHDWTRLVARIGPVWNRNLGLLSTIQGCVMGTKCRRSTIQYATFNPAQSTLLYNCITTPTLYICICAPGKSDIRSHLRSHLVSPGIAQLNASFLAVGNIVVVERAYIAIHIWFDVSGCHFCITLLTYVDSCYTPDLYHTHRYFCKTL